MSRAATRRPAQDDSDDEGSSSSSSRPAAPLRTDPKGDEYKAAAAKKLKSFSFFSSSNKYEDAIELYQKAAAQYKMNKNWAEAGQIYKICAELFRDKIKDAHEEGGMYEAAAKAFKNVDTKGQSHASASLHACFTSSAKPCSLRRVCCICVCVCVFRVPSLLSEFGRSSDGEQQVFDGGEDLEGDGGHAGEGA